MASRYLLSLISVLSTIDLPLEFGSSCSTTISRPLVINTATPLAFKLPWEKMISEPHSFFHLYSPAFVEWVSWRNIKSVFCFFLCFVFSFVFYTRWTLHFRKLLRPPTLRETSFRLSDLILEFVICQPLLESFIMRELINNLL